MTSRRAFLHQMLHWAIGVPAALGLGAMHTPLAQAVPASNTFILAQLQYRGGQWDPRPRATIPLMQEVRLRTSVETRDERQVLTLRDPALFAYPFLYELVASFQECRRYSPWPWRTSRAADEHGAVRKMRGTPRWSVGRNVRDRRVFCPCAPWVYWSRIHAFSPHTTRG